MLSLIGRVRPDVVTLNEVSPMWADKLVLLSSAYPYRTVCTIDNHAGGVAILSLRPFAEGTEGKCLEGGTFATATVDLGGRLVEIGALHLHWPWPFSQSYQIDNITPLLAETARNVDPRRRLQRGAVERRFGSHRQCRRHDARRPRSVRPGSIGCCRNSCASPACR